MYRILVVDDFIDNTLFLQTLLELEGYTVDTASSGLAAIDIIETLCPHVALIDIFLSDMIGYSLVERIRENPNLSELRVVLLTSSSVLKEDEAIASGANAFIRKPIDPDQLLAIVKKLCNQKVEP